VTDYYSLLPGNTDAGWDRLTKRYQNSRAGGRANYEQFWNSIDQVAVSNARTTGKNQAEATITYSYKDGRTIPEDTAFQFKDEHGELKIDRTDVLGGSSG
jgi:hypothetical protein